MLLLRDAVVQGPYDQYQYNDGNTSPCFPVDTHGVELLNWANIFTVVSDVIFFLLIALD